MLTAYQQHAAVVTANLVGMREVLIIGIPVAVILILTALVAYERHAESAEARKRTDHLKRWLHEQGPGPRE